MHQTPQAGASGPLETDVASVQLRSATRLSWPLVLGYSFLWAGVCDLVLELSLRVHGGVPWSASIIVGMVFIWIVILLLYSITSRLRHAFWISLVLTLSLAGINVAKLQVLAFPLVPSDVAFLRTPGMFVSVADPVALGAAALLLPCTALLVLRLGTYLGRKRAASTQEAPSWRRGVITRAVAATLCVVALGHASQFNNGPNVWRAAFERSGGGWAHWDQVQNYQHNGFVGGALYNLPAEVMERPHDYEAETLNKVIDPYRSEPAPQVADGPNIVIVLNESLGDPLQIEGVELAEDPLSLLREKMAAHWSGSLQVPYYGTGTSAVEFEVLTGQTVSLFEPQITTPFQQYLHEMKDYPSVVGWLQTLGYHTVAIHPYTTQMYQRPKVYEALGFDDFISQDAMRSQQRIEDGRFISDAAAYQEVLSQIRGSREPVLAHVVTMQNHVPIEDAYERPIPVQGEAAGDSEIEQWARGLAYSDDALENLVRDLGATDEPTLLVFFGDHYPGIFSDRVRSLNEGTGMLTTPLLIWSSEPGTPRDLGLTAPTTVVPRALEKYGMALPPYYRLLLDFQDEVGVLRGAKVIDETGVATPTSDLTGTRARLLEELRLIQYDFSVGQRQALEALWYDAS